ncbi:hypothetical protein DFH07DRAFT_961665 [Mycena maculata]|uniref:F-box domain-containing protein n=1 Tax=Mycena maculata TaxID=230809 RepID=A0AAD7N758_9AGAR|nr:hypothetical protein DFH07DRAFT_961665 [Mycena maculata]
MDTANSDRLIAESEAKISSFDSQIENLQALRAEEYQKIAVLKYLGSPIHVLPMEVLGEIFSFSIAPVRDRATDLQENLNAIIPLSQVCRCWRQVALSTPRLWTELSITLEPYFGWAEIAWIASWLRRSMHLPLSVTIFAEENHTNPAVLNEILLVKSRLTHLEIVIPATAFLPAIEPLFEAPLDALQTLRITEVNGESSWGEPINLSAFAPSLRTLILPKEVENTFFSNIPWSRLVHLQLLIGLPNEFIAVLRQCVNLERLDIGILAWDAIDDYPPQEMDLTLRNLRHMSITVLFDTSDLGEFGPLFQPLVLPELTSLKIVYDKGVDVLWPQAEFSRFQSRCPSIQHLEIQVIKDLDEPRQLETITGFTFRSLILILRSSPALKSLTLLSFPHCIDDALLAALQYRASDEPLVPRLETLSWDGIGHGFEESALEAMIRSRWRPAGQSPAATSLLAVARLANISIRCGEESPLSEPFIARMQDCIEDGNTLS